MTYDTKNDRYDIIFEFKHENSWYYITKDYDLLRKKPEVNLPYSPINDFKKYNLKRYFDLIKPESIHGDLEKIVLKIMEDL